MLVNARKNFIFKKVFVISEIELIDHILPLPWLQFNTRYIQAYLKVCNFAEFPTDENLHNYNGE
jgi:hypothetical protein